MIKVEERWSTIIYRKKDNFNAIANYLNSKPRKRRIIKIRQRNYVLYCLVKYSKNTGFIRRHLR